MRLILYGGSGMGFTIETPLSPHMAGRTTRLIARLFFSSIRRVEHRGVKRGDKVQVLLPGTNTATSNKREPICGLPALSKLATSTKRDPICALLLQSVSAVWLSCSLEQKYPPPLEQNWTPRTSTDRSVPCRLNQSRPLRTNANRSVPSSLYQG